MVILTVSFVQSLQTNENVSRIMMTTQYAL